jgi:hypothetical protein
MRIQVLLSSFNNNADLDPQPCSDLVAVKAVNVAAQYSLSLQFAWRCAGCSFTYLTECYGVFRKRMP